MRNALLQGLNALVNVKGKSLDLQGDGDIHRALRAAFKQRDGVTSGMDGGDKTIFVQFKPDAACFVLIGPPGDIAGIAAQIFMFFFNLNLPALILTVYFF